MCTYLSGRVCVCVCVCVHVPAAVVVVVAVERFVADDAGLGEVQRRVGAQRIAQLVGAG